MPNLPAPAAVKEPARHYHIRVAGHLDQPWTAWFGGLTVTQEAEGVTRLAGPVIDQAALHGLLKKVRDLGLPLVSVNRVEPDPPAEVEEEPE